MQSQAIVRLPTYSSSIRSFAAQCDIWSLGVVLYTLMAGFSPFYAATQADTLKRIKAAEYEFAEEYWSHISEDGKYVTAELLYTRYETDCEQ